MRCLHRVGWLAISLYVTVWLCDCVTLRLCGCANLVRVSVQIVGSLHIACDIV